MSSICGFIANKCEDKCRSNCASSHTTSDSSQASSRTSENCKCIGVPTIRGMRVSKVIPGLTQWQANKIYADVVYVLRNKWSEKYKISLPIPIESTKMSFTEYTPLPMGQEGYYTNTESDFPTKWGSKEISLCCKKLYDEEETIQAVAKKYFEIKSETSKAPFEHVLKDLRDWVLEQ